MVGDIAQQDFDEGHHILSTGNKFKESVEKLEDIQLG